MHVIPLFKPAAAVTLAVALASSLAGEASYAAAPRPPAEQVAAEQVNIVGTRTAAPDLPTPAEAQIDKDGLLKNGLVANGNSYG